MIQTISASALFLHFNRSATPEQFNHSLMFSQITSDFGCHAGQLRWPLGISVLKQPMRCRHLRKHFPIALERRPGMNEPETPLLMLLRTCRIQTRNACFVDTGIALKCGGSIDR